MRFVIWVFTVLLTFGCSASETVPLPPIPTDAPVVKQEIPTEDEPDAPATEENTGLEVFGDIETIALISDSTFSGTLDAQDANVHREDSGIYGDAFVVHLEASHRVTLHMFSVEFDAQLYVFAHNNELVDQGINDDILVLRNTSDEPIDYVVFLTTTFPQQTGGYTIVLGVPEPVVAGPPAERPLPPLEWVDGLDEEDPLRNFFIADVTFENTQDLELPFGGPVVGTLVDVEGIIRGPEVRDGAPAESYVFEVMAGETYLIDVYSAYIDPYIYLEGPSFSTSNDDGGRGLNSRILFEAQESETVRLYVTLYSADRSSAEEVFTVLLQHLLPQEPVPNFPGLETELDTDESIELIPFEDVEGSLEEGDAQFILRGRAAGYGDAFTLNLQLGERLLVVVDRVNAPFQIEAVVLDSDFQFRTVSRQVLAFEVEADTDMELTVVVYGDYGQYTVKVITLD